MKCLKLTTLFLTIFFVISIPCFATKFGVVYHIPNGVWKSTSDHSMIKSNFIWEWDGSGKTSNPLEPGNPPPPNNWFDDKNYTEKDVNFLRTDEVRGGKIHETNNIYHFAITNGTGGQIGKTIKSNSFNVPDVIKDNGLVEIIVNCEKTSDSTGKWYALLKCEKKDGNTVYYNIPITVN